MKLHESMFPIVINSVGNSLITFTSPTDGVWVSGNKIGDMHDLEYFLSKVITNPGLYIVESVGGHKFPITFNCLGGVITFESFNRGVWHAEWPSDTESVTGYHISHFFQGGYEIMNNSIESIVGDIVIEPNYQECAIEDMPLGAKLLGFYHDGEFVDLTFRPRVIEVHDDCICLLMHFHHKGDGVGGEANFPRNRKIRYEK